MKAASDALLSATGWWVRAAGAPVQHSPGTSVLLGSALLDSESVRFFTQT